MARPRSGEWFSRVAGVADAGVVVFQSGKWMRLPGGVR
jgi:hypothetical protein